MAVRVMFLSLIALACGAPAAADRPARTNADWWSLAPLRQPPPPVAANDDWSRNEVDRFILARLKSNKLSPSPRADARTLVRRIYFDLIGLPAPPEVIDRFAKDPSQEQWERLVDGLLASEHYGERWARHWMDVARFGESHGYEYNAGRESAWHYRDWVIRALNADMPYDRFARTQIAGDVFAPNTVEGAAAVGFLVAGVHNTVVGKSPAMKAQARQDELEEIAAAVSQTFLGLTIHCARCHDHKYDPISTKEYYQFIAALDGVRHGTRDIRDNSDAKPKAARVYTVVPANPGRMRVHNRGSVTDLGEQVDPGGLSAIQGVSPAFELGDSATDAARRQQLARWITHPDNGPFHRVIVNRVWHHHFGRGLVDSPSDLGFNGGKPTHPQLLGWLAVWFRDNGYSLKQLHRLVLTSATYQQSSNPRSNPSHAAAIRTDQTNTLLWRQNARRIDAETLRDAVLDMAGVLNQTQFGPGFKDVRTEKVGVAYYYHAIDPVGEAFNRRTIYRWHVRGQRSALLDTFDCPDPSTTTPVRNVTTTPSQALSQWNHPFILRMSRHFAERIKTEAGPDAGNQVAQAYRRVLGRAPDEEERAHATRLVKAHGLATLARVLFNTNESIWIE